MVEKKDENVFSVSIPEPECRLASLHLCLRTVQLKHTNRVRGQSDSLRKCFITHFRP